MKITTNNRPRHTLQWWDLTTKEQRKWEGLDDLEDLAFVRYRGEVYLVSDFQSIPRNCGFEPRDKLGDWHGYLSDSFFSCVVIRFTSEDWEDVILGTCIM